MDFNYVNLISNLINVFKQVKRFITFVNIYPFV